MGNDRAWGQRLSIIRIIGATMFEKIISINILKHNVRKFHWNEETANQNSTS